MKETIKCPVCGGAIQEKEKFFGCTNWKNEDGGCTFKIWKSVAQRTLTEEEVEELLERGQVGPLSGFVSRKSGKEFSCTLKMRDDFSGVDFVFPERE